MSPSPTGLPVGRHFAPIRRPNLRDEIGNRICVASPEQRPLLGVVTFRSGAAPVDQIVCELAKLILLVGG